MAEHKPYSILEEKLHALTHAVAAVGALIAFGFMMAKADTPLEMVAVSIYGGAMIVMFGLSAFYHFKYKSPHQAFYKLLDHCAIYLKIAGGYTPFTLLVLPIDYAMWVMIAVWSVAFIGIFFKTYAYKKGKSKNLSYVSLATYLLMSWAAVALVFDLMDLMSHMGIVWLGIGGAFYTVGAIFYALKSIRYTHVIWHLFVIAGSYSHFIAVYVYIL